MHTESAQQSKSSAKTVSPGEAKRFSRAKPIFAGLFLLALFAALAVMALRPRQQREREATEIAERAQGAPTVLVATAALQPARGDLMLPGSMQAVIETPIFARSEGYVRQRLVDIGDRVHAGQLLAVVEAPEIDRQVDQAKATLSRSEAALEQARATLTQSDTQLKLAEVTAQRWATLFTKRVVSRQEVDEKQAAFEARRADNKAAQANVVAATNSVEASRAELRRLMELKNFQELRAPFAGIITERNTEVGSLIRAGSSEGHELFRLAQTDSLRIIVNVPQINVPAIRIGQGAQVTVDELPDRRFTGKIARTANALDPATRTLLIEIHVPNPDQVLLPGMYAHVLLANARTAPSVTIPGETLVIRADGPQVAVVAQDGRVHFQRVVLGRDYGDTIEVTSGLRGGESIVINPSDDVTENGVVKFRPAQEPTPKSGRSSR